MSNIIMAFLLAIYIFCPCDVCTAQRRKNWSITVTVKCTIIGHKQTIFLFGTQAFLLLAFWKESSGNVAIAAHILYVNPIKNRERCDVRAQKKREKWLVSRRERTVSSLEKLWERGIVFFVNLTHDILHLWFCFLLLLQKSICNDDTRKD